MKAKRMSSNITSLGKKVLQCHICYPKNKEIKGQRQNDSIWLSGFNTSNVLNFDG